MHEILAILVPIVLSYVIVSVVIPPLLRVVKAKQLFEPHDERKVHEDVVPTIGGVAIFIGYIMSIFLCTKTSCINELRFLFPALVLMLFIGLKDDLIVISAKKKFLVQLFAAVMLVVMGDIRIVHLNGILNVYELHYWVSVPLSVFIIVAAINAFNLIDGIDGLASGIAFIASVAIGICFLMIGHPEFGIACFALTGSVAAFFRYNVFSKRYKLFMGDTGSLIIGITLITLSIKFHEYALQAPPAVFSDYSLALIGAFLVVPLIDIVRVMAIRIWQGKSPFYADRNHIHHLVLNISSSHFLATLKILVVNLLVIFYTAMLILFEFNINAIIVSYVSLGFLMAFLTFKLSEKKMRGNINRRNVLHPKKNPT